MKKLLFHLLIFTLFAAAAGCSSGKDDDGNPDVRFYAVPASLNFEAGKTTLQLSISTTGHWTIVCDDEWLEAVPAEGTGSAKVGITAQANPLAQQRTSSLTIAYGGAEPAVVPVTQKVSGEESVDLFGSTDEMKAYLKARVEACNYAESVTTTAGRVLKFGFKGAATRGVRKEAIPFFTVNGGGYWAADGVATPVKADAEALRGVARGDADGRRNDRFRRGRHGHGRSCGRSRCAALRARHGEIRLLRLRRRRGDPDRERA